MEYKQYIKLNFILRQKYWNLAKLFFPSHKIFIFMFTSFEIILRHLLFQTIRERFLFMIQFFQELLGYVVYKLKCRWMCSILSYVRSTLKLTIKYKFNINRCRLICSIISYVRSTLKLTINYKFNIDRCRWMCMYSVICKIYIKTYHKLQV